MVMIEDVYHSSLKFLYPLSLKRTFEMIGMEAMRLVEAKYSSVFMMNEGRLRRMYASSPALYEVQARKRGVTYQAYKSGKPVLRKEDELETTHPKFAEIEIGEDLSIPLTYNKITLGVLSVLSERGKRFSKKDIAILKLFSPLAMMALRKALLYNELHKALNERDLFISIASHELKNPLTSIYAYSQIIANKIKKGEMPEMDKVDRLLLEELRLNKIMSDFLEVNRIKTGKISFEMKKINLLEVLESAMESFRNIDKEEHRLRSRFERQKAVVWGDPDKIHQAILNVITNSGKYSEKNSLITVSLKQEEDYFRIEIKDRGSGIPEKDLPYVFDRFYRADNTKNQGMGIGLYLVKYIILKHGGKLEIKSRVNKGTTVSILLPILNEKRTGELQTKQNGGS